MEKDRKNGFMEMIHEKIGKDHELTPIIALLVDMVEDEDQFEELYDIHAGIEEYGQFLTEREAKEIVSEFISFDGSRGAKWNPDILFSTVESLGGDKSVDGRYNCWTLFTLMNMMHSDYGGALMTELQGEDYALMCYRLALAWMADRDHKNNVRSYFLE